MKLRFFNLIILFVLIFSLSDTISAKYPIVSADDQWISVRSKNFFLVGDAKEKDIKAVATKLEQFREVFRLLFPNMKFSQAIETNVIVFKNVKSYKPFLPKRGDGKADTGVAGYFQPGEDVNYITLSTEGEKEDTFGTIFHEYVHFILNTNFGRSEIPPWFNEGLAEYYQTFRIKDDKEIHIGVFQQNHLYFLQSNELIRLKDFFALDNYSLHQNGNHSRSIFYAQAWALMHYIMQSNQGNNLGKFLNLTTNGTDAENAFKQIFGKNYGEMEKELRNYVKQRSYNYSVITLKNKLEFEAEMTTTPLKEAEANAYLGDLLYHTHEYADAEVYLQKALTLDAEQSMANTSLGLVKMRQNKFDEAKKYLQKAIAGNRRNHFAHYNYAYVLSRESMDESGWVTGYPTETAEIMRKSLLEAININPNFTESYELLAFINLVNNENLDQAISLMNKALQLQPGNDDYLMKIAHIYLRQQKFDEAEKIAAKIAKTASEPAMRSQAENILSNIKAVRQNLEEAKKFGETENFAENIPSGSVMKSSLTAEQIAKIESDNKIISLNQQIKKPENDEKHIVGHIQKIECVSGGVRYTIKTDDATLLFKSIDFQSLSLMALSDEALSVSISCDADLKSYKTVFTFRDERDTKMKTVGTLSGMYFVPEDFVLKSKEELAQMKRIVVIDDEERKQQLLAGIKESLRELQSGEKQEIGIVEKIECFKNEMIFRVKIGEQSLSLKTNSPNDVSITYFTRDAAGMQFGCGIKPPPIKAVITFRPDKKDSNKGEIVALEFVPKDFELE